MNLNIVLYVLLFLIPVNSIASKIAPESRDRITKACLKSMENNEKRLSHYKEICACVGESHFRLAAKETDSRIANDRINWTVKFYETEELSKLQKLADVNSIFSSFDSQVVDDCIRKNSN